MFFQWQKNSLVLNVRVQTRASSDSIAEILGEQIKIRITAPPVDGKANQHLIGFLAKTFKVAKSNVIILSGETGKNKRIRIRNPARLPVCITNV